jgi:hypothetical protein
MKSINNKTVNVSGKDVTYAELLKMCNDSTPTQGWTKATMKTAIKIDYVLEKKGETIELEDADFEYLKPLVSNMNWVIKSQVLVDFTDYIESL